MIPIPSKTSPVFATDLESDLFGNIYRTKNIDFSKKGYLRLAKRATSLYTGEEDDDFDTLQAILSDDDNLYVVTVQNMFVSTLTDTNSPLSFTERTGGPSLGVYSDATMYKALLHATGGTTVHSYSGGTGGSWTSRVTGLTDNVPHPLCVSEHQNYLAIGNGAGVKLVDTSWAGVTDLVLPSEYVVVWIRWRQSQLYIGTRHLYGGEAKMFIWNGSGTAAQTGYGAQCEWIYSGCEYRGSMAIATSNGQLMRFNGGGFDTLAEFPVFTEKLPWTSNASVPNLNGRVASRGLAASGNILYVCIDGKLDVNEDGREPPGPYLLAQPGGLWVFDPNVGLYHKAGLNFDRYTTPTLTYENSQFTCAAGHGGQTGDPVYMSAVGSLTGVTVGRTYYMIADSDEQFRLALTQKDAQDETAITLGGTLGAGVLTIDNRKSVGATYNERTGPVHIMGGLRTNLFYGSEVFFGGSTNDESGNEKAVLASFGLGYNVGTFETPKIRSQQVKDQWQKIISAFKRLILTGKIVIKYRSEERFGLPASLGQLTWTSSTTFTVDTTVYDFKPVEEGDEIEIMSGAGAGYTVHVSSIDKTTSTYAVTVDEELPVSNTQTATYIADNWKKLITLSKDSQDNDQGLNTTPLDEGVNSKWLQLKVELRGFQVSIEGTDVINRSSEISG